MTVRFTRTTHFRATAAEALALSLDVGTHTSSMAASGERIVGGVREGMMRLGDTVTWRATHFGVPIAMTSRITELDAPHRFVDEQLRARSRASATFTDSKMPPTVR